MPNTLRETDDHARLYLKKTQDCVCSLTLKGEYLTMNPAGCILHGIDGSEDIKGKSLLDIISQNRAEVENAISHAAGGNEVTVEYSIVPKGGEEVWWSSRFTPVKSGDGQTESILQIAIDITMQKETKQAFRRAEETLTKEHNDLIQLFQQVERGKKEWEATMDCVNDMIIVTDKDSKIVRYNTALLKFTNKSHGEPIGIDLEALLSEYSLEAMTFYAGSIELYHNPTQRWFTLNSYPFKDSHAELDHTVITIHETTEMKKITDELEKAYKELKDTQSQVLQREKMASIGQLAAGVAHEINNPIGFVTSNLGTLSRYKNKLMEFINTQSNALASCENAEVVDEINNLKKKLKIDYVLEDIGQLIEESLDGSERVKKIVQNLKTFSRVDEAEFKPVDLNECIESTLNIVWNELKYKATVEKDYGTIPHVKCFPQQMNQVFMNLLVNAAQAIEKQGAVRIRTWNGGSTVNISISDTGCGIPEDKKNRIFEPFFTTKEVGKGTGLGLSICYEIVKKHNGEITVDSKAGEGTTFTLSLPVTEEG